MKQLPFCVLALVFPFIGLSAATLDVDSRIDSVTLYQGMAKVTRTFEVDLPAGDADSIRFSHLPKNVDPCNMQVAVTGGVELDFGAVSFSNDYSEKDTSQALKDLEAKKREIETRIASIKADKKALEDSVQGRLALVGAINKGIGETGKIELYELSKTASIDAAKVTRDAFEKAAALDRDLEKEEELLSAADEAVRKEKERAQLTCANYVVHVVSQGGVTKGTISYYVWQSSWNPYYVVKADTVGGAVEVSYLSKIIQTSGEDWNNVELSLETAQQAGNGRPQEPHTVYLLKNQPSDFLAGAPAPESAMRSSVFFTLKDKPDAVDAIGSVSTSYTGFRASIEGRVTIPSSSNVGNKRATPIVLPLATRSMSCEFQTETVPVTEETAYLVAKLKNGFDLPMLAGETQVIVDGSTNGTDHIKDTLPGTDLTLGLGVNQNVLVERKTIAEKGGEGGIFGGKRVETRSYINKLTNHMRIPAKVVVRDVVPISSDEKIVVEVKQPKNAKIDPEKGTFETVVNVQPGASIELPTEYSVSYPSDWRITDF